VKILIVEQPDPRESLARHLLGEYHVDFEWTHTASEADLRALAEDYQPNLVFCADRMPASSRRGAMELLRLLSSRTAQILIVHMGGPPPQLLEYLEQNADADAATRVPPSENMPATWRAALPSMFETSWDAVTLSDAAGWITCANTNACQILSETRATLLGTILDPRYFSRPEHRLHRMAFFDDGGYPTPVHLSDLVARVCTRARGAHTALPITALHLPGLRVLTEALGQGAADVMLEIVDGQLRSDAIGCGLVTRLGEDDIMLVLPDLVRASEAAIHVLGERRLMERRSTEPACDLPQATERRLADRRDAITSTPLRPAVVDGLDDALRRHAIGVHYQPQFELESGRGCGVEALARWYLTSGEAVAPTVFIPAAERAGMIDALGARVLKIACDAAASWRGRDSQQLTVSVKVSTLQIGPAFSRTLAEVLRTSGFAPERLELEIAETALLADERTTMECLLEWKRMNVRTAVIHAGTDYSSLRYLSRAPIDRLKLDRALIGRMNSSERDESMVRALIALGQELDIDVIAEGVETEAQLHVLMQLRCPQVQGFLLGRPMPLVPVQIALRKPWGNLPKAPAPIYQPASAPVAPISRGSASRS
jgi:EAL domain-containing protein (putative c-di-GMP-specific phosphodiesterase class I)/CheY-like chemotaxis protein